MVGELEQIVLDIDPGQNLCCEDLPSFVLQILEEGSEDTRSAVVSGAGSTKPIELDVHLKTGKLLVRDGRQLRGQRRLLGWVFGNRRQMAQGIVPIHGVACGVLSAVVAGAAAAKGCRN